MALTLQRLVLDGFQLAPPGGPQPLFWPESLVAGPGASLNATDVRFVVRSPALFAQYLDFFISTKALLWTVSLKEGVCARARARGVWRGGCSLGEAGSTAGHMCRHTPIVRSGAVCPARQELATPARA